MRPYAVVLLAVTFVVGWLCGASWVRVTTHEATFECSGARLVGTLFVAADAFDVPGRMIIARNEAGNEKLISRDLFENCSEVPTNRK